MMTEDELTMVRDAADGMLAQHCDRALLRAAAEGNWPTALWDDVKAAGLTRAVVSEARGGAGLSLHDGLGLVMIAAEHAAPIPLAETMIAAWLLDQAGLDIPDGPIALMAGTTAPRVAWGRSPHIVAIVGRTLFLVPSADTRVRHGSNIAGEPRDEVVFDPAGRASVASPLDEADLEPLLAGIRAIQIAGALARITDLAAGYARDRVQFGRPIGQFQAIQHQLAVLATQAAAAAAAADLARAAIATGDYLPGCAIAKARCGEAAGAGAAIAHQVHGAIGFTLEHDLQFWTKRLWSWRDEHGSETRWNALVGRQLLRGGGDALWPLLTGI